MATRDPDFPLVAHFTEPHVRLQASGTLGVGSSNEVWTMGCKVVCTAAGTPTVPEIANQNDLADIADAGLAAFSGLITTIGGQGFSALVSNDVALSEVKAYAVGPDNHQDNTRRTETRFPPSNAPVVGQWTPAGSGLAVGGRLPYSVAVCITFRGDTFRKGLGALGRFYVPGPNIFASAGAGAAPLVDGLMDPGTVAIFAAAGAAFVNTINNHAVTGNFQHKVANVGTTTGLQANVRWQMVHEVIVDSRPDTVRRRSNKIGGRGKVITAIA